MRAIFAEVASAVAALMGERQRIQPPPPRSSASHCDDCSVSKNSCTDDPHFSVRPWRGWFSKSSLYLHHLLSKKQIKPSYRIFESNMCVLSYCLRSASCISALIKRARTHVPEGRGCVCVRTFYCKAVCSCLRKCFSCRIVDFVESRYSSKNVLHLHCTAGIVFNLIRFVRTRSCNRFDFDLESRPKVRNVFWIHEKIELFFISHPNIRHS